MTVYGHPEPFFKLMTKVAIRGYIFGVISALGAGAYIIYARKHATDPSLLAPYEYRRLLINSYCGTDHKESEEGTFCLDHKCALHYGESLDDKLENSTKQRRRFNIDSYENGTIFSAKFKELYVNWEPAIYSGLLGTAAGISAYIVLCRPFIKQVPKNQLLVTFFNTRGARINKQLFGLVKDRTYNVFNYYENEEAISLSKEMLQRDGPINRFAAKVMSLIPSIEHKMHVLNTDPISFPFAVDCTSKDGKSVPITGILKVRPTDWDCGGGVGGSNNFDDRVNEEEKYKWNMIPTLLDLTPEQISSRCQEVIAFELKHLVSGMSVEQDITNDLQGFGVFVQQNIGRALRDAFGLRVVNAKMLTVRMSEEAYIDQSAKQDSEKLE